MADELSKRQIVERISPRYVGRLLEEAGLKPHQIWYWLNPSHDEQFDKKISDVINVYHVLWCQGQVGVLVKYE